VTTRYIEYMPVDELVPAVQNPKQHDAEQIAQSQHRFGYVEPVVLDERTQRLVAGHGRLEGLALLWAAGFDPPEGILEDERGRWNVPVTRGWSSTNDVEAAALLLAVNKLVMVGGMDQDALSQMLSDMNDELTSWEGIGFSDVELADLLTRRDPRFELIVSAATESDRHRIAATVRDMGGEARYL